MVFSSNNCNSSVSSINPKSFVISPFIVSRIPDNICS